MTVNNPEVAEELAQLAWIEGQIEADWARISAEQEEQDYQLWLAGRLEDGWTAEESDREAWSDELVARWEALAEG